MEPQDQFTCQKCGNICEHNFGQGSNPIHRQQFLCYPCKKTHDMWADQQLERILDNKSLAEETRIIEETYGDYQFQGHDRDYINENKESHRTIKDNIKSQTMGVSARPNILSRARSLAPSSYCSPRTFHSAQSTLASYVTAPNGLGHELRTFNSPRSTLSSHMTAMIGSSPSSRTPIPNHFRLKGDEVFSSDWLFHLQSRGILLNPKDQLDWSGRGQHVEYEPKDEECIPLQVEKVLGYSATAIVESVRCRRIRLARKKIRCNRRLKKEDAIIEVEHLQRLQHTHIIRVVGTYTLKKDLFILLYPAAEWNLDEYLDDVMESMQNPGVEVRAPLKYANQYMPFFFGCLSRALHFIHGKNIKHMDIKPKNVLIRKAQSWFWRIYIADFGIARAYKSAADSETDSPTSFTRTYAAPEVVLQDKRGFSADVFSLGCVYMEILAVLASTSDCNRRERLYQIRAEGPDSSFHSNLDAIRRWCHVAYQTVDENLILKRKLHNIFPTVASSMLDESPHKRPGTEDLQEYTTELCCLRCEHGTNAPEPFEAA